MSSCPRTDAVDFDRLHHYRARGSVPDILVNEQVRGLGAQVEQASPGLEEVESQHPERYVRLDVEAKFLRQ